MNNVSIETIWSSFERTSELKVTDFNKEFRIKIVEYSAGKVSKTHIKGIAGLCEMLGTYKAAIMCQNAWLSSKQVPKYRDRLTGYTVCFFRR